MPGHISYPRTAAVASAWSDYRHAVALADLGAVDQAIFLLLEIIDDINAPPLLKDAARRLLIAFCADRYKDESAIPGHGNANHGSQVKLEQHVMRLETGIRPDNSRVPTKISTSFHTATSQLEAVTQGLIELIQRDPVDLPIKVYSTGRTILPTRSVIVHSRGQGGFGAGLTKASGQNKKTGNLKSARVVMEYDLRFRRFTTPLTQFPIADEEQDD